MIIFNLWTIPVALVIYLILLGIEKLFPSLMSGANTAWTIGVTTTIIGGVTERFGIRGRVFFIPIWLVGIGILCFQLGWPGWILLGIIVVAGFIWLFRWSKKKEAEEWQKAQAELVKAGVPPASSEREFWDWTRTTLYLPVGQDYTPEICDHNLKVLQAFKQANPILSPEEKSALSALEEFLNGAKTSAKPPPVDMKLRQTIEDFIRKKADKARKDVPLATATMPPPVPLRS